MMVDDCDDVGVNDIQSISGCTDATCGGHTASRFSMPLTSLGAKKYYLGIFFKVPNNLIAWQFKIRKDKSVPAGKLVQGGAVLQVPWDAPGQVNSVFNIKGSCAKNYCHPNPQLHQTQTRSRISFKEFENWLQLHLCRNEGQGVSNASNVFTTDGLHTTSASNGINATEAQ